MRTWPRALAVMLVAATAGILGMRWTVGRALERAAVDEARRRAEAMAQAVASPALAAAAERGDESAMLALLLAARDAGASSALVADSDGRIIAHSDVSRKGGTLRSDIVLAAALSKDEPQWRLVDEGKILELVLPLHGGPDVDAMLLGSVQPAKVVLGLEVPLTEELARARRLWSRAALWLLAVGLVALGGCLYALRRVLTSFDRTVEMVLDGVIVLDEKLRLRQFNPAARAMVGESFEVPSDVLDELRAGRPVRDEEFRIKSADGRMLEVLCAATPLASGGAVLTLKDVTARKRLQELEAEHHRDNMQREFVANVSHQFRTPIAAIKGFAETLLGGALEDVSARREFVEIILHHSDRLSTLVEDLLQLSVLESHEYRDAREPLELKPFCESVARSIEPLVTKAGLVLAVDAEAGVTAVVDKRHLEHLLLNLLRNAVDYNEPGGSVTLSVRADGPLAHLCVSNTGMGIEPDDLGRLFRRFHRSREAKARKPEGTGLGLLIVKRIVERHGGDVWAESEPGKGASFHVTLTRPDQGPPEDRPKGPAGR